MPIDGVGLQAHFIVGEVPTTLVENMREFVALGVEGVITNVPAVVGGTVRQTCADRAAVPLRQ